MSSMIDCSDLPWNFEAFRRFLAYDIVQQAAATLCLFERQPLFSDVALIENFSQIIKTRTGMEWVPRRQASPGVLFNTEGNLFRNKARVFTSFYLIDPIQFKNGRLELTEFGKALGCGLIDEHRFYREICSRFEYPHPAYDDNWDAWTAAKVSVKPLVFLLKVLVEIYKIDAIAEVSIGELAAYAHPRPFYNEVSEIALRIIEARKGLNKVLRKRSDQVDRKIGDILGFLCVGQLCYYKEDKVRLNLFSTHREEKTAFWHKREGQDGLAELERFLDDAINQ